MLLNIYKNTSANNNIHKNIVLLKTVDVKIKSPCDLVHPIFIIRKDSALPLKVTNYCYVKDLGRYYYIDNITMDNGGIMNLHCTCDVLMSFASQILNRTTLVERQEHKYNNYIADNELKVRQKRVMTTKNIGNLGNNYSYILTVTGGRSDL